MPRQYQAGLVFINEDTRQYQTEAGFLNAPRIRMPWLAFDLSAALKETKSAAVIAAATSVPTISAATSAPGIGAVNSSPSIPSATSAPTV